MDANIDDRVIGITGLIEQVIGKSFSKSFANTGHRVW